MLKRKMNHDDDGCSRQVLCVVLAFYFNAIIFFLVAKLYESYFHNQTPQLTPGIVSSSIHA